MNDEDIPLDNARLKECAAKYDALVTLLTDDIDRSVLDAGDRLKAVCNVAVGFDNVDIPAATDLGIVVTNTPGVLTDTTADFAWALLMTIARRVLEGDRYLHDGKFHGWGIEMLLGQDVHGAVLGIVGMGRIGQAMARRARGFDMRVLYFDEFRLDAKKEQELSVEYCDLDKLFAESDFLSLHTPLTEETRHLIRWERLTQMKPSACLINTARGPIVNEVDLARALREERIAGAALDVFEDEPRVHQDLLDLPNVVLTPHIASASVATRSRMATMAAENCLAILAGLRPANPVNPDVFESERLRVAPAAQAHDSPSQPIGQG